MQDLLGEPAVQAVVLIARRTRSVGCSDRGEGGGADGGCPDDDPLDSDARDLRGGGCCRSTIGWQVRERDSQFFPGARAQDLRGTLVEFVSRDPADLKRLGQLGERPVAVGVGYPEVTVGIAAGSAVHDSFSFGAEFWT